MDPLCVGTSGETADKSVSVEAAKMATLRENGAEKALSRRSSGSSMASSSGVATGASHHARIAAQLSDVDEETLSNGVRTALSVGLVQAESAFYRVLEEAKIYLIELRKSDDGEEEVGAITEMMKTTGRTSSRDRLQNDRNAYCVKKMPEEVVVSSGRLECPFGAQQLPTTFIRLAHIENGFMILSMTEKQGLRKKSKESFLLERLPASAKAVEEHGRFYYRVLVPIELRKGPDLLAPVISRHLFKNAEEIIECSTVYRCPESSVTFVKLAYEDGWLFASLNSGIKVLEQLESEPEIDYGQFFYIVRIPVGIRVAPNIMAQRAGKGYKLHSIVEASQRFTPPGSKITYVKVCREKNSRCTCSTSHQNHETPAGSPRAKVRWELTDEERALMPRSSSTSSLASAQSWNCAGGWIFETTMDGQVVLEPIEKPAVRQIERLFYRVLEDVEILPTPGIFSSSFAIPGSQGRSRADPPGSSSSKRKRLKDTLIECSERIVPALPASDGSSTVPELAFVKLRHDVGWICERRLQPPYSMVLEQVQGYAMTRDEPKFYRVLVPVHLRSAPDFECPRLPGASSLAVGYVFESCLQYTPPGSRITYVKVNTDSSGPGNNGASGWLFEQTPSGDKVLETLDEDPEKKAGKFFYRVLADRKEVLLSPERNGEVVKYLFENTFFAAEMEYTLPRTQETYVRLAKEKGWVALDAPYASKDTQTLQRISEELFNLYYTPPGWVSIGHPNRSWFKVPDEACRTVLAEETLLQMQVFKARNILAACSQGRDDVPLVRHGAITLDNGTVSWKCTLEEIKHSASALLFTFPWKQIWWVFELENGERHSVELQHGLRGGFRAVLFDGEIKVQNRSVGDILWDSGSEFVFEWGKHTFKVIIALEGAFFSQFLQFYSYSLLVDEEEIVPIDY
ncbi:hypothetical protein Poli38472_011977 [Pythium oligandrum]|uniref:Uncharacterized protein n=1 Tax=Pythium oligandrum TaxID=41045 RepID=A0A8K1CNF5_PYTOL|nr:hypothetical protein Poli38472_011977 [Pythium oligandrum]|eukprot:TMW66861.1 hypothetical protein Poli38472_011977 [Pythium oligandrum]